MAQVQKFDSLMELLDAFPDEATCAAHLEAVRWPHGIVCQWCGESRKFARITRGHRYKCADCRKEFSVRKGTIFEESRLPLRKWFAAMWLFSQHRKGIPSTQLAREIGVKQSTAWFMLGRIREVAGALNAHGGPVTGVAEVDETYIGGKAKNMHARERERRITGRGGVDKTPVAGAVNREGKVRARPIAVADRNELHAFVRENVAQGAVLVTDEHPAYRGLSKDYPHLTVAHSAGEYVRGMAYTNGVESFWALLKRGYVGVFHSMSNKHLHRYVDEFEARWNMAGLNGAGRVNRLLGAAPGLRLTYKDLTA